MNIHIPTLCTVWKEKEIESKKEKKDLLRNPQKTLEVLWDLNFYTNEDLHHFA